MRQSEALQRFTPMAVRVAQHAKERARRAGASQVGTEHLLLGLLQEPEGIAAQALTRLGVLFRVVRDEVARLPVSTGEGRTWSTEARQALECALDEAVELNAAMGRPGIVDTEHVLLALTRAPACTAMRVLRTVRVEPTRLRQEVLRLVRAIGEGGGFLQAAEALVLDLPAEAPEPEPPLRVWEPLPAEAQSPAPEPEPEPSAAEPEPPALAAEEPAAVVEPEPPALVTEEPAVAAAPEPMPPAAEELAAEAEPEPVPPAPEPAAETVPPAPTPKPSVPEPAPPVWTGSVLTDVNTCFGYDPRTGVTTTQEAVRQAGERWGVCSAYAFSLGALLYGARAGNEETLAGCEEDDYFGPVAVLCPIAGRPHRMVTWAKECGFAFARIFPDVHGFAFDGQACRDLLSACGAERLPVMVSALAAGPGNLRRGLDGIRATIILTDNRYGILGEVLALAGRVPDLYLEVSGVNTPDGIAMLAEAFGADRLLWGSGYPALQVGCAAMLLQHSGLRPEQIALIGHGTAQRLLGR
jgi:hypothetical protein